MGTTHIGHSPIRRCQVWFINHRLNHYLLKNPLEMFHMVDRFMSEDMGGWKEVSYTLAQSRDSLNKNSLSVWINLRVLPEASTNIRSASSWPSTDKQDLARLEKMKPKLKPTALNIYSWPWKALMGILYVFVIYIKYWTWRIIKDTHIRRMAILEIP
jgi:hypothetical protein